MTATETATDVVCPICGARLVPEPSLPTATAEASTWLGRCENQHWWLQSLVFGWLPITPGAIAADGAVPQVLETRRVQQNF
jgi:hypothetical protein